MEAVIDALLRSNSLDLVECNYKILARLKLSNVGIMNWVGGVDRVNLVCFYR